LELNWIASYFVHIEKLILENLKKETINELWDFLALYLEKKQIKW
jgi:hypothetical protein